MTNDDGDNDKVSGIKNDGKINIVANAKKLSPGGCISTFSYRDPEVVYRNKLLNAQNAERLDMGSSLVGNEILNIRGDNIGTGHYRLKVGLKVHEKFIIDLWYDKR